MTTPSPFSSLHTVITGGAGALGSAVVTRILNAGGFCHIPVLDDAELKRFPHLTHDRVRIERGVNLTNEQTVRDFYACCADHAQAKNGRFWASIHIAGGFHYAPLADTSLADLRKMLDTNLVTCFLCCREAARHMMTKPSSPAMDNPPQTGASTPANKPPQTGANTPAGKPPVGSGRIVNVAARPALEPRQGANMSAYTASKAAVAALTQALAEELVADGIFVNAVAPSIMDTPANRKSMPDADFSKWPSTDDVAATIAFLASAQNLSTRGGVVPVYGRT